MGEATVKKLCVCYICGSSHAYVWLTKVDTIRKRNPMATPHPATSHQKKRKKKSKRKIVYFRNLMVVQFEAGGTQKILITESLEKKGGKRIAINYLQRE